MNKKLWTGIGLVVVILGVAFSYGDSSEFTGAIRKKKSAVKPQPGATNVESPLKRGASKKEDAVKKEVLPSGEKTAAKEVVAENLQGAPPVTKEAVLTDAVAVSQKGAQLSAEMKSILVRIDDTLKLLSEEQKMLRKELKERGDSIMNNIRVVANSIVGGASARAPEPPPVPAPSQTSAPAQTAAAGDPPGFKDGKRVFRDGPTITGATAGISFGARLSRQRGDIDGDGFEDFVIGAYYATNGGAVNAGELTIVYGDADVLLTRRSVLSPKIADAVCGRQIAIIPDITGDGRDEVAATCFRNHQKAYLWYGRQGGIPNDTPPDTVFTDAGLTGNTDFGYAIRNVGDFDGDGKPDMAISSSYGFNELTAPRVWLLYGKGAAFAATVDLSTEVAANTATLFTGIPKTTFGINLTGLANADGDALGDLVVAAPGLSSRGSDRNGGFYVIHGSAALRGATVDISTTTTTAVDTRFGPDGNFRLMGNTIFAEDMDGDGVEDVVASMRGTGVQIYKVTPGSGIATVYSTLVPDGITEGHEVARVGDVNGDRVTDLIFGVRDQATVLLTPKPLTDRTATDYALPLTTSVGPFYAWVGTAGDLNRDGLPDLIFGSIDGNGTVVVKY